MTNNELVKRLQGYSGDNLYLKTLQTAVNNGEELSFTQITLGKKFLLTHAIRTNDKTIVIDKIKEYKIDWDRYHIRPPYPFQRLGINWLLNKEKAILGDDMGLGKSLQAIVAALELNASRVLIVCPASLKLNWAKEIIPYCNEVSIIHKDWNPDKFTIINYDILKKYKEKILKHKFELIIADEAHMIKNMQSQRSKAFATIASKSKRVWLLTGTPIANKPIDFYNLLKVCKHELGKNKQMFGQQYCGGQLTHWGYDYNGASNLKELHYKIQNIILRRKKEEVLDLPPKVRTPMYLELVGKDLKGYNSAVEEYYEKKYDESLDPMSESYGESQSEFGEAFVELAVLRKYTALQKAKDGSTAEMVRNAFDQNKKVVIFTNYLDVIDTFKEEFKDECLTLDGRLDIHERQRRVDLFQSSKGPNLLVCNLAIASFGLTLTAATVGIMNDLSWSPAVMQQAEDRLYRIGQKELVNILYPIYDNTIDSIMFEALKGKMKNINEAVDGNDVESFGKENIIREVYNKLKKANVFRS
jgi:SWI/SNF-related matrix-associated actin-dependent regulator 1 of chromatin subfamily A